MRLSRTRAALLVMALLLMSCAKTLRPGALNEFDSRAFDTLGTAAISIEALKQQCPSGPTSPCPQAKKDAINKIIDSYNLARQAWLDYRALVAAGKPATAAQLNTLTTRVILSMDEYRKLFQ